MMHNGLNATKRALNRFADAYIEPEYQQLAQFNTADVPLPHHVPSNSSAQTDALFDPHRGAGAQRPTNYETDFFWSVYLCTAFEPVAERDFDGRIDGEDGPEHEDSLLGAAEPEYAFLLAEVMQDVGNSGRYLSEAVIRSRVAIHEIGHQFGASHASHDENFHRNNVDNIMHKAAADPAILDTSFYFHPEDVARLRKYYETPGPKRRLP